MKMKIENDLDELKQEKKYLEDFKRDYIKQNQHIPKEELSVLKKFPSLIDSLFNFARMYLVCESCGKTYHAVTFGSSLMQCSECGKNQKNQ